MAERGRREASTARPGNVVNNARQKHRTQEQIALDNAEKQRVKEEKDRVAQEKRKSGVRRIADVEQQMRAEDERSRATAARPDLRTMELKRAVLDKSHQESPERETPPQNLSSTSPSSSPRDPYTLIQDGIDPMDDGDDSDKDPDYVALEEAPSEDEIGTDQDPIDNEADDEAEIAAKVAAFEATLRAKPPAKKRTSTKAAKGTLRSEIQNMQESQPTGSKRKPADHDVPEGAEPAKKTKQRKAAEGGVKADWRQELRLGKPVKKSSTDWRRSAVSSHASSTSATSGPTHASASSSAGDLAPGELHQDEPEASLEAARTSRGQGTTARMGITLTKKTLVVDVNGKAKRQAKPRYTNNDLPFPSDGFSNDLKHYHETFVVDLVDWAGTLETPFIAAGIPEFKPTVTDLWTKYFSAYQLTDAVDSLAAGVIGNWRSSIGKRAVVVVQKHIQTLPTLNARRKWVADKLHDLTFLYRDPAKKSGSYRSDLFLTVFGVHLRYILKNEVSFGLPVGAASVVAAALERALLLCQSGELSTQGLPRRGKKTAHSFSTVPWAERAASYLKGIRVLGIQKWQEIYTLAREYADFKEDDGGDPFDNTTDGESTDGYVDPRARIVVSDDEPVEDDEGPVAGPSSSGAGVGFV
ncbi:hypothetical protein DFH07DRAFT_769627 [Mycena maculata]|uniref:Uncharacterized protein n=1 Tax=Mycena maculata TaxID=230809 RepID=A0AAD7JPR2_9AGAR|nr:hypothetical protein DFH07DRAFT_769627 [Mycena maculata]